MFQAERTEHILKILRTKNNCSLHILCEALECSIATVRRDLIELEKMGLVQRTRGGVVLVSGGRAEYAYAFREQEHSEQKRYLCSLANQFLSNGVSLFLDSSSTVRGLCPLLQNYNHISAVTNGIATALALMELDGVDTFITGGHIKNGSASATGNLSSDCLNQFRADIAFFSCRGIDSDGTYEADQQQARIKQRMIANSKQAILLIDSSKFGSSFFYRLSSFSQISAVITDRMPDAQTRKSIQDAGAELIY